MSDLICIEKSMDGTGETVTWKEIRSYAAILDAGERYPDFSAAYEENPWAAMARYGKEIIPKVFVMDYHDGESWMSGHLLPFQADLPA